MRNERAEMAVVLPKTIIIAPAQNKRPISRDSASLFSVQSMSSDGDDSVQESSPRKRKRLTHLTPEERMLRRKLKNRVAAQTARDRKKMRMQELEEAVAALEAENQRLQVENIALKEQTGSLSRENTALREKLEQGKSNCESTPSDGCNPPESAALNTPQQQEKGSILSLAASQLLTYMLLTVMSLNLLDCCSRLLKTHQLMEVKQRAVAKVAAVQRPDHRLQWWGPQQQSWNPSKN